MILNDLGIIRHSTKEGTARCVSRLRKCHARRPADNVDIWRQVEFKRRFVIDGALSGPYKKNTGPFPNVARCLDTFCRGKFTYFYVFSCKYLANVKYYLLIYRRSFFHYAKIDLKDIKEKSINIKKKYTALAKSVRHLYFFYLQFFHLYCFLLVTGIVHKFKGLFKTKNNSQVP